MNKSITITKAMGRGWKKACEVHEIAGFPGYVDTTRNKMDVMKRNGQLETRRVFGVECRRWLTEYRVVK